MVISDIGRQCRISGCGHSVDTYLGSCSHLVILPTHDMNALKEAISNLRGNNLRHVSTIAFEDRPNMYEESSANFVLFVRLALMSAIPSSARFFFVSLATARESVQGHAVRMCSAATRGKQKKQTQKKISSPSMSRTAPNGGPGGIPSSGRWGLGMKRLHSSCSLVSRTTCGRPAR